MPRKGQFKIRDEYWTVNFGDPGRGNLGVCLHDKKQIIIKPNRPLVEMFSTIIHEALHAAHPYLTEDEILTGEQTAMNALKRAGCLSHLLTEED